MSNLTFEQVIQRTINLINQWQKVEPKDWGIEGNMIELMKQVGELSQNVMMVENYYDPERWKNPKYNQASKEKIAIELSDILFMIIRIAHHYQIDLENTHLNEIKKDEQRLKERASTNNQ